MLRESIGNRWGIGGESMGRVGELRRGSYRGEFATFVAGEFARYASRRIAAIGRGGSKEPSSPYAQPSVVPVCPTLPSFPYASEREPRSALGF